MCWGFINKKGEIVIEPKFFTINNSEFQDGLACVGVHTVYPQKYGIIYGYIDKSGEMIIPPMFEYVSEFCNGLAVVKIKDYEGKNKSGVIDKHGNFIIKPQHDFIMIGPSYYKGLITIYLDKETIYYKNGEFILDPKDAPLNDYDDNPLMPIVQGDKYGYRDKNNQIVIEPKFDKAEHFLSRNNGFARVKINNKYGYIDKTGAYVINPEFDELGYFKDELAEAKTGGKYGFIDKRGKVVIKPMFDSVRDFSEGVAVVSVDKKFGVINKIGEYVIHPQFDKLCSFSEGLAGVEFSKIMYNDNGKEWGCKDENGKWVHSNNFNYILGISKWIL